MCSTKLTETEKASEEASWENTGWIPKRWMEISGGGKYENNEEGNSWKKDKAVWLGAGERMSVRNFPC